MSALKEDTSILYQAAVLGECFINPLLRVMSQTLKFLLVHDFKSNSEVNQMR
jgi:hypothetical protein